MRTLTGRLAEVFYSMHDSCRHCTVVAAYILPGAALPEIRHACNHPDNWVSGNDNCKPHNCPLVRDLTHTVDAAGREVAA